MCVTVQTLCPACKVLLPGIQYRKTYGCRPDNTRRCVNGGLRLPHHLNGEALGTFECPIDGCVLSQRVVEREKQAVIEARRDMVRDRFPVPGVWDAVDSEDGNGGGGSRVIEDPTSDDEVLLLTGRKGTRVLEGSPSMLASMAEGMAGAAVPGLSTGSPPSEGSRGDAVGGGGSDGGVRGGSNGGGRGGRGFGGRGGS